MHFLWFCWSVLLISKWICAESQGFPSLSPKFLHHCSCSANARLNHAFHCNEKVQMALTLLQKGLDRKKTAAAAFLSKAQRGEVAETLQTTEASLCRVHIPPVYPRLALVYQGKALKFIAALSSEKLSVLPCAPFSRVIKYFCSRALHMDIKFSSQTWCHFWFQRLSIFRSYMATLTIISHTSQSLTHYLSLQKACIWKVPENKQ